ncbi:MAG: amidinotransferase [Gammaproteobacteria bacterium]|nr:amidinotransferase [Gammaproteobacteria bacterium]
MQRTPMRQCAGTVFMVRPAAFGSNPQTAASNAMQGAPPGDAAAVASRALAEFDGCVRALESEGIRVVVGADTPSPARPDAVFPNNWVSFHADGTLVLYPMLAPNRRLERREELVAQVCAATGFQPRRRLDLSAHERGGRILEGTGSLVLDHRARVAYAARSARTDEGLVAEWARALGYQAEVFDALDARGQPYYHTNVLMWLGSRCAMVCSEALAAADRARVLARLRADADRELIEIDRGAVAAFAGNMLELASWDEALGDTSVLVMSTTARAALAGPQLGQLGACVDTILAVPLPTIERVGGGGARCMLAEVPEVLP